MYLQYNLATVLLDIYPTEMKTYVHAETCTWMLTAALFLIAPNGKLSNCPSMGEWIYCGISMPRYSTHQEKERNIDKDHNLDETQGNNDGWEKKATYWMTPFI